VKHAWNDDGLAEPPHRSPATQVIPVSGSPGMVSHCLTVSWGESERQGETEQLDVMGFLFLVQGGSVPIITAHSASIHRRKPPEMILRVLRAAPRRRVPLNLGVDATTCLHHARRP
jgi:hypothetical protein